MGGIQPYRTGRILLFNGSASKLRANPQCEYVLAKGRSPDLLGVVDIAAQVQVPVYLISDPRIHKKDIIRRPANALESVAYEGTDEEKLQVGQELMIGGRREVLRKIAVSGRGDAGDGSRRGDAGAWRTGVVRQQPGKAEGGERSDAPREIPTVIGCRGGAKARLGKILDQVSDIGIAINDVVSGKDLQAEVDAMC
jgi:hypothetical protein